MDVIVRRKDEAIPTMKQSPPRSVIARRYDEAIPMDYYTTFLI
jgi:hypothetical protein